MGYRIWDVLMGYTSASTAVNAANEGYDRFIPQPDSWVRLRDQLSPFSFDQALLLCELVADEWLAWVPDYGETSLHRQQFYRLE
jgi:hypothetical protein